MAGSTVDGINQVLNRGEAGAPTFDGGVISTFPTDYGHWGGSVIFNSDDTWNFSTTDPNASDGIDFLTVALHEIGHVLGIGWRLGNQTTWDSLVEGANFTGPLARASNGNVSPNLDAGGIHWATNTPSNHTVAAFGESHGNEQDGLMEALAGGSSSSSSFTVPTDLELAALRDIGWELTPTLPNFAVAPNLSSGTPTIQIPTTTGVNYQVSSSTLPNQLTPSGATIIGDGSIQTWLDPAGLAERGFYRVEASLPNALNLQSTNSLKKSALPSPALSTEQLPNFPPSQCQCDFH